MLGQLARPSYDIHIPSAQKTSTSGTEASASKGGGVCVFFLYLVSWRVKSWVEHDTFLPTTEMTVLISRTLILSHKIFEWKSQVSWPLVGIFQFHQVCPISPPSHGSCSIMFPLTLKIQRIWLPGLIVPNTLAGYWKKTNHNWIHGGLSLRC